MTWQELIEKLQLLSAEKRQQQVLVFNAYDAAFFPVSVLQFATVDDDQAAVKEGQPFLFLD